MPTDHPAARPPAAGLPVPDLPAADRSVPRYEIRVAGRLGPRWSAWFDGLDLTDEPGGVTRLSGPVVDQAALHGLLARLRDLGIPLISLTELRPERVPERVPEPTVAATTSPESPISPNPPGATT